MRYLSVCSGIEAATVAWKPLGWEAAAFSEIEPFPRSVLSHHFPDVPLHGDFTTIKGDEYGPIDLLVGGTPCQSFSVAGLRGGLADERGNLALEYLRLADRSRPRWLVWENVPGVLSSLSHASPDPCPPPPPVDLGCGGAEMESFDDYFSEEVHAFECFLAGLRELGYGFAYRVLDAQHFGVPQRRRRVFVVGYSGDWRRAAAVLFERHSLQGHPAPRRQAGQGIANAITERPDRGGGNSEGQRLIPSTGETSHCLNAGGMGRQDYETETPIASFVEGAHGVTMNDVAEPLQSGGGKPGQGYAAVCFTAKDHGADAQENLSPTLRAGGHSGSHANAGVMPAVAMSVRTANTSSNGWGIQEEVSHTLDRTAGPAVFASAVRRLTPRECERLQGFPDNFTLVPHRGKPAADGPRYKALGNSMAVPVMAWIGARIARVEALSIERLAA